MYKIVFTKQAVKNLDNLKKSGISAKAKLLVVVRLALFSPTGLQPDRINIKSSTIGALANNFFISLSSDRNLSKMGRATKNHTFFEENTPSHTFSMGTNGVVTDIIIMQSV